MNLLTLPLELPFLPIKGVIRLGEIIAEEADRQLHDPARIRRVLEDAQRRWEAGEITDEERAQIEDQAAELLVPGQPAVAGPEDDDGS